MRRVISAVVFLPLFWVIVKKLGLVAYDALLIAAALVALFELFRLAEARGHSCHRPIGVVVALLFLASFIVPGLRIEYPLVICATFIGVLFGYLLALRHLNFPPKGEEIGSDLVFLLFFVVWAADVGAFYVGSYLGRHPLAPQVSPKKTVEGAVGGVAVALAAAFVARAWFMHDLSVVDCAVLGTLLGITGILGDLVESMLKRGAGVKDSASVVPGHGGVLDRVDSVLYAAPILYYYYLFVMRIA
jgi:phosphatidate cytidylyltransferase